MYVSGGTGILEDTLGKVETLLIRHDAENPAPPGMHPPHIKATVGIDNIKAVLREYDVAWEFGSRGSDSYVLTEIDPSHTHLGELNGENPRLTLFVGQRYHITVDDPETHPLEIIAKGPTASQDRVLLSMRPDVSAPFASDAGVDWHDPGTGTVTLTLTRNLWSALHGEEDQSPGYRCSSHSQAMRGDFSIME